jgi:hypothetical protein
MADSNIPCLYGIRLSIKPPLRFIIILFPKQKLRTKMSNTKQILKDAIADAKAVRETALANAKLALEEAFTPQLQSMLAAKLQEMEEEDEVKEEVAEGAEDQMEETLDLEALLAEDSVEEAKEEGEEEAEEETSEEAPEEEAGEEKEGEEEEDKDITEMSPEEVEEYIRTIAAEEFAKLETEQGEKVAGDAGEEIDLDAELGAEAAADEEEINLDEMIDETEETVNEEEIDENDINIDELLAEFGLSEEEEVKENYDEDEDDSKSKMEEELAQALATIDELRSSIQEVNLLNAKLLYMNKVFKGTNLTESQKVDVVKTFDKAESAKEAKLVYESLITSFTKKAETKSNIKESVGFASKAVGMITNSGAKVIETDAQYNRWEKLAFGK